MATEMAVQILSCAPDVAQDPQGGKKVTPVLSQGYARHAEELLQPMRAFGIRIEVWLTDPMTHQRGENFLSAAISAATPPAT